MSEMEFKECPYCFEQIHVNAKVCHNCGRIVDEKLKELKERRMTYIILAVFLGGLGIHSFYAGDKKKGILQLLLTIFVCTLLFSVIWVVIDIITILTNPNMDITEIDKQNNATEKKEPLLQRVKSFMKSSDFKSVIEYCDKLIEKNPKNGWAYFYKFLAESNWNDEDNFDKISNFLDNKTFWMASYYADEKLKEKFKFSLLWEEEDLRRRNRDLQYRNERTHRIRLLERYIRVWGVLRLDVDTREKIEKRLEEECNVLYNFYFENTDEQKILTVELITPFEDIEKLEKKSRKKILKTIGVIVGTIVTIVVILVMYFSSAFYQYKTAKKYYEKGNYKQAIEYYHKSADKGHEIAQYELGKYYFEKKDYVEAVKWYCNAAEQGFANAQYELGKYYLEQGNSNSAMQWLQKSADQGYVEAQYLLGNLYYTGIEVFKNYTEAVKWYRKASEQNHAEAKKQLESEEISLYILATEKSDVKAQYELYKYYSEQGNQSSAMSWLQKSAENGYAVAQYQMAEFYYNSKNYVEAIKWYRKAAVQGHSEAKKQLESEEISLYILATEKNDAKAQCDLGEYYLEQGIEQGNSNSAMQWLQKSADQGYAEAQYLLGNLYYTGIEVFENYTEAVKWYRKAAEHGHSEAKKQLASEEISLYILATEKNDLKAQYELYKYYSEQGNQSGAMSWLQKSAEQGFAEAQYSLGVCYKNGDGVTKNIAEAVKWYRKSAEQGHSEAKQQLESEEISIYILATEKNDAKAQCELGKYFLSQKDDTNAMLWFEKSAEQGYAEAQCVLGKYYLENKDDANAILWFEKSAEQGYAEAQCVLGKYYLENKDDTNAILWLKKSADQGYAEAQYVLGKYYFDKGDYEQAVVLLEKASSNNHKQAKELLKICIAATQGMRFSRDYKTLVECNNKNITKCVIPDSVTTIGEEAFSGCYNLQSVVIPDSVTTIGDVAFGWCYKLQSVVIPDSVTTIGKCAFESCDNLQSVTIGNGVTEIGNSAFYNCYKLQSVVIPNSVTTIGKRAFNKCYKLQSVTIPNSVTTIGFEAFFGCKNLKEVRVPKNCAIVVYAFPFDCEVIKY